MIVGYPQFESLSLRHVFNNLRGVTVKLRSSNRDRDYWITILTRMSHRGEGSGRKVARSGGGARSTSGNHRTGLPRRACSPSSPRVYRFFVRARHTTPPTRRAAQIRLATPSLSV